MLSASTLFHEIQADDASFALFCSIAAKGEDQGGWENSRIARLSPDPGLAPKIARHGADEHKHGRIFAALLRRRDLQAAPVPPEADYCMLLERHGLGLLHRQLAAEEQLSMEDVLAYLAHSRVTEQRASEQMRMLRRVFADDPEVGRAFRVIADDEENHLSYCHEELRRLSGEGYGPAIRALLRHTAAVEIPIYRDVSLAVLRHMGRLLGWSAARRRVLAAGVYVLYLYDRMFGWRRLVALRPPARPGAMADSE